MSPHDDRFPRGPAGSGLSTRDGRNALHSPPAGRPGPSSSSARAPPACFAAIFAARSGARVLVLETRPVPGAKIRVSGGGRCNVLPSRVELVELPHERDPGTRFGTSSSPGRSTRSGASSRPSSRSRSRSSPPGRCFPASNRSLDVVEALLGECRRAGVTAPRRLAGRVPFATVDSGDGGGPRAPRPLRLGRRGISARRAVLSTGGLSLPRTGSDGAGIGMARSLGHSVRELRPRARPARHPGSRLGRARRRVPADAPSGQALGGFSSRSTRGTLLFTHRGFSGPVVLDLSRHLTGRGSGADPPPRSLGRMGGPRTGKTCSPRRGSAPSRRSSASACRGGSWTGRSRWPGAPRRADDERAPPRREEANRRGSDPSVPSRSRGQRRVTRRRR